MSLASDRRVGLRFRAARTRACLTQEQLAGALGLRHRQTIASIESGERPLSARELVSAMDALGVDLDYFTDPFRLVGEGQFSFRTSTDVAVAVLDDFEDRAGRWIAMYRELSLEQGIKPRWLESKLALTAGSSFEDAQAAGESVADRWQLGSCPAAKLRSAMESRASILVLEVDTPLGVSGAASRVPGLSCVLVNRNDPARRRNFDLAHELFHLLTWDTMPPERTENVSVPRTGKGWRVERLAENFAAAVLMPEKILRRRWKRPSGETGTHQRINEIADDFRVSGTACKWRLHNAGLLSRSDLAEIDDRRLVANGRSTDAPPGVPAFSKPFIDRVVVALDAGRLSVRRAASLLGLSLADLVSLIRGYGHETYFEA
ncbi:MAG: XRE family transcriptional regulator [Gemmatimonadetes bacterium]|nr:XRE family transcriptional regulator [Candidatus Palauibacter rhopaloidicola]